MAALTLVEVLVAFTLVLFVLMLILHFTRLGGRFSADLLEGGASQVDVRLIVESLVADVRSAYRIGSGTEGEAGRLVLVCFARPDASDRVALNDQASYPFASFDGNTVHRIQARRVTYDFDPAASALTRRVETGTLASTARSGALTCTDHAFQAVGAEAKVLSSRVLRFEAHPFSLRGEDVVALTDAARVDEASFVVLRLEVGPREGGAGSTPGRGQELVTKVWSFRKALDEAHPHVFSSVDLDVSY